MYEKLKRWYDQGLWSESMILNAVQKGLITGACAQIILKEENV